MNNNFSFEGIQFRARMKELDRIRNENFAETHPEIAKAMKYDAT